MYGINTITGQCIYQTPCGWCARLDRVCKMKRKSIKYDCVYYKDGRCMGTKEMDFCKENECTNMKFE